MTSASSAARDTRCALSKAPQMPEAGIWAKAEGSGSYLWEVRGCHERGRGLAGSLHLLAALDPDPPTG